MTSPTAMCSMKFLLAPLRNALKLLNAGPLSIPFMARQLLSPSLT